MEELIKKVASYVVTFFVGVFLTPFIGGFVKEFFDERTRRLKHRLNVAKHVLGLCNEASVSLFERSPNDQIRVNAVLTNVKGIDKNISVDMERMVSLWRLISGYAARKNLTIDDINFLTEMRSEAENKKEELISWANNIRN